MSDPNRSGSGSGLTVSGAVVQGDQRGRTLGFPTANVALPDDAAWLTDGVWAGFVTRADGTVHTAAISVGRRSTFYGTDGLRLIEAYLLDFDGDLYGELITIELSRRIRGQEAFADVDALVARMSADVAQVREWSLVPAHPAGDCDPRTTRG